MNEITDKSTLVSTKVYFLSTSRRITYEIYVNNLISYEPVAKEVFSFTLGERETLRIRGLFFTRGGVLKNSYDLGSFFNLSGEEIYILAGEKQAWLADKEEFYGRLKKLKHKFTLDV